MKRIILAISAVLAVLLPTSAADAFTCDATYTGSGSDLVAWLNETSPYTNIVPDNGTACIAAGTYDPSGDSQTISSGGPKRIRSVSTGIANLYDAGYYRSTA